MSSCEPLLLRRPVRAIVPVSPAAAEIAAAREEGRREGRASAQAEADHRLVELRSELGRLQRETFASLLAAVEALEAKVRGALPGLALELARRLLAGWEPPPEVVAALCRDALDQLFPETQGLELVLSARDAEVVRQFEVDWSADYPGLVIRIDPALTAGDCLVRSRFGVVDSRAATRLAALEHELTQP